MIGLAFALFIYIIGGLTFLPLILVAVLAYIFFTLSIREDVTSEQPDQTLLRHGDDTDNIRSASPALDEKYEKQGSAENEVAAGYFAVCREYVPGGVNGKPPERTTPTGSTVVSSPSPSVYQSMYRSIFDRKPAAGPLDNKTAGKPQKKGGNVFYVVLRHNHLILFADEEQLEVLYVISLAHHDISIYGGGEEIPDGELFIKRNALCLSRKTDAGEVNVDGTTSKPFYLFADNTSDKEDFYFAMLKNQERVPGKANNPPVPIQFEVKDIIDLVQRLHSSEEHMQTRWLNAIIGRLFLGLYKTKDVENFIRAKITKKISRVKTPSFLSKIVLNHVDMGESAPYITNPRLKDLNVEGECCAEADLKYTGNFRVEIAATARIELGTRFKAREVNLVLAVVVKKIQGHVQLRVKPPPSNRIWYAFTSMPLVELSIEPIVSSRQITYTLILRQIENRIKEVIAESVVLPFWDDTAFFSTEDKKWRGGIWVDDTTPTAHDAEQAAAEEGDVEEVEHLESETKTSDLPLMEKSLTEPIPDTSLSPSMTARKAAKSVFNLGGKASASSTSIDTARSTGSEKPRAIRHGSFTSSSAPIISTDNINADVFMPTTPPDQSNAAAIMAALSAKSQHATPAGSPSRASSFSTEPKLGSFSSASSETSDTPKLDKTDASAMDSEDETVEQLTPHATSQKQGNKARSEDDHDVRTASPTKSTAGSTLFSNYSDGRNHERPNSESPRIESSSSSARSVQLPDASNANKRVALTAVANAAATAKRWGLNALAARNAGKEGHPEDSRPNLSQPMGRGRPLPPPGTPLPPPDRKTRTAPIPVPRRRPVVVPELPQRPVSSRRHSREESLTLHDDHEAPKAPMLPTRRAHSPNPSAADESVFVIAAPDSDPTTPMIETKQADLLLHWPDTEIASGGKINLQPSTAAVTTSDLEDDKHVRESNNVAGANINNNKNDTEKGIKAAVAAVPVPSPALPVRTDSFAPSAAATSSLPRLPRRRPLPSSSPEDDHGHLSSWAAAQEEEARGKTMWVDEDSGNLHQ